MADSLVIDRAPLASGSVETWTLNDPASRNALSEAMVDALLAACERAAADADLRGVVLRGAGGHFCAGGSLGGFAKTIGQPLAAGEAEPLVPQVVQAQKERFLARWNEALTAGDTQVNAEAGQERALAEATAYAIRIDVAEELGRLAAHLDEIESVLKKGGDIGKRLDFLIQELHREANTLGSKSAALEMTRISVDMKVSIEQMREQVQNIE